MFDQKSNFHPQLARKLGLIWAE